MIYSGVLSIFGHFALLWLVLIVSSANSYPKGETTLARNDDASSLKITFSTTFQFYNKHYTSLYVNTNGAISFDIPVSQFTPARFPLSDGRALVAPFWADVDTRTSGTIMYGAYTTPEYLQEASKDVRSFFPAFQQFSATWMFVTTWEKVPFYGSKIDSTNTFQATLITNGRYSFVRFNYREIKWTTGTESGGDANGLGGTVAECGFNAGDGTNWYSITKARNIKLLDLPYTKQKEGKQPGIWMFRIDGNKIEEGGCNTNGFLSFSKPHHKVPMFGGLNIEVRGPCFKPTHNIVCKFGNGVQLPGAFVKSSIAKCTIPMVGFIGEAKISLSLDNGTTFPFSGKFYYVSQSLEVAEKHVLTNWNNLPNGKQMEIFWTLAALQSGVSIHIARFVMENGEVKFKGLQTVKNTKACALPRTNCLQIMLTKKDLEGYKNAKGKRYLSFIRVQKKNLFQTQASTSHEWLWSDAIIWHNAGYSEWRCRNWESNEPDPKIYQDDQSLMSCPPRKDKAVDDDGRFVIYKEGRDIFFPPDIVTTGIVCYRKIRPSDKNYGQRCCYNRRTLELLVGHNEKAGTLQRVHPDAGYPYISHLFNDVLPFYDCCRWSEGLCHLYYRKRPSNIGAGYTPPRAALTFGDPHIITLDGVRYTFNGLGEFVALQVSHEELMLQGRMEQVPPINGTSITATVYTAFAMRSNMTETIQMELNYLGGVNVVVDGKEEEFGDDHIILFSNGYIKKKMNTTKYSVTFNNGIIVIVEGSTQLLQLMVKVPDQFLGRTSGLLGYFDDDKEKEFILPDGTFLNTTSTAETIHYEFGLKWAVDKNQSLFTYYGDRNHDYFNKLNFVPLFFDYNNLTFADANLEAEARAVCNDDVQCLVDIMATGQTSFAMMSRNITNEFRAILNVTTRKDCVQLPLEFHLGKMERKDGLKEGEIHYFFTCEPHYILNGSSHIACQNGIWNGTKPSCRGCSEIGPNMVVTDINLYGNEVFYNVSCKTGYEMFGNGILKCQHGNWLWNDTKCVKG